MASCTSGTRSRTGDRIYPDLGLSRLPINHIYHKYRRFFPAVYIGRSVNWPHMFIFCRRRDSVERYLRCRYTSGVVTTHRSFTALRGGADKSLARPTSRCRRTESIVFLERWVCSCAEMEVFSCYRGWKEACQPTRAISTTSRRGLSSSFFPCKERRRRKCTPHCNKH